MQQDLEAEHPRFVKFSQLSSEATSKLENDNPVGASNIRRRHEEVSQRWENLVCRMDEHSSVVGRFLYFCLNFFSLVHRLVCVSIFLKRFLFSLSLLFWIVTVDKIIFIVSMHVYSWFEAEKLIRKK